MKHLILYIVALLFSVGAYSQTEISADSLLTLGNKCFSLRKYKEAVKYYRKSADMGNTDAAWLVSKCYLNDCGITTFNIYRLQHYAEIAANGGNAEAMTVLGNIYYNFEEYPEAIEWYVKGANAGNEISMLNLGKMAFSGTGMEQSGGLAIQYWEMSAEKDNAEAEALLGKCYLFGTATEQDVDKGVKWLTKAADNDDSESAYILATYLEQLATDSTDYVDIAYYYMVAANQGKAEAQASLGLLYWEGKGVEKNEKTAFYWFLQSAREGNDIGIYNTAFCYYLGRGVAQNKAKAMEYFRLSAAKGNKQAKELLKTLE